MFALATCEYAFVTKIISKNFYSLYLYENLMQISLVMFVVIFSFFVVVVVQVVCVCVCVCVCEFKSCEYKVPLYSLACLLLKK